MARYSVHPRDVSSDECIPPAHSPSTTVRTVRRHSVLHLDCQGKELPADDYQRGGNNPMLHRVDPTFWLTDWARDRILHT